MQRVQKRAGRGATRVCVSTWEEEHESKGLRDGREWFGRRTRWELVAEWSETVGDQILNQSVLERRTSECLRGAERELLGAVG